MDFIIYQTPVQHCFEDIWEQRQYLRLKKFMHKRRHTQSGEVFENFVYCASLSDLHALVNHWNRLANLISVATPYYIYWTEAVHEI